MSAPALSARLEVRRGDRFTLDAALDVEPGQTLAVMGPSGAGKSTLLAALAGVVPLDGGWVRLGERTLSRPGATVAAAARDTVLLGQDPRLFPHLRVRENVAFAMRVRGMRSRVAARRADELLHRVGLPETGDLAPAELSGGQQQRVALARAVAASPGLVLLDEPLTSLDPGTAADIRMLLAELLAPLTCVLVTHDAVDAVALAARLIVLEDGTPTQDGPVREVFTHPASAFTATLAGLNRVSGTVTAGIWRAGALTLPAPGLADGAHIMCCRPDQVRRASDGWRTRIIRVEQRVGGVLLHTADPAIAWEEPFERWAEHPLTPGAEVELALDPGAWRYLPG